MLTLSSTEQSTCRHCTGLGCIHCNGRGYFVRRIHRRVEGPFSAALMAAAKDAARKRAAEIDRTRAFLAAR